MSATSYPLGSDVFTPGVRGTIVESRILSGGVVIVGVRDATGEIRYYDESQVRAAS